MTESSLRPFASSLAGTGRADNLEMCLDRIFGLWALPATRLEG